MQIRKKILLNVCAVVVVICFSALEKQFEDTLIDLH